VDAGDFRVEVPDERKQMYGDYVGKEVVFGIRPEHLHAPEFAPPGTIGARMKGTVEVIELLGHELHLYLNSGKNNFVATVDIRLLVDVGNTIDLEMDMNNMHLFDKNTELAIR
jgi:multiple sugar transport system ATP-binding protein